MARCILVVHPDIAIRHLAMTNLQRKGYRVSSASCLADALASVADNPPDAILVDERGQSMIDSLAEDPMTRNIRVITVGRSAPDLPPPE